MGRTAMKMRTQRLRDALHCKAKRTGLPAATGPTHGADMAAQQVFPRPNRSRIHSFRDSPKLVASFFFPRPPSLLQHYYMTLVRRTAPAQAQLDRGAFFFPLAAPPRKEPP